MARVFVDTNVLFPFSLMDLALALTEDGVHEVLWTEVLLTEWERVVVRERCRSAESVARIASAIREFFPEGHIAADAYVDLVAEMPGGDFDDRHVPPHEAVGKAAHVTVLKAALLEMLTIWAANSADRDR